MVFYEIIGWLVFWVTLIIGIVIFAKRKKFYPIFYLISAALYVYTAGFVIEVFNFTRLGILGILVASAVIFMLVGYYLSKVLEDEKQ